MKSLKAYELIEDEIKSIYRSRLQTQILLSLNTGNKTLLQLREITGSSSQAIIPKIRILESSNFVEIDRHSYRLTAIGKIATNRINESVLTFGVITKFENFWKNHHLKGIPDTLLNEIGDLYNSQVIMDTSEDVFKAFAHYLKNLRESREVYVVSSFTSLELIDAVIERLSQGISVQVIITKDVFEKLDKEPYVELCHRMLQFQNLKLCVTGEYVKIGLTVTEKFLSLGLYKKDGALYDFSEDFFSFDDKAIEWGRKFFQYYKERSIAPEIRDI